MSVVADTIFPVRYEQLEELAKQKMAKEVFDYVQSGAGAEETLRANRQAFEQWKIVPRFLKDVSKLSTKVKVNGTEFDAPILLAPIGMQGIVHNEGELATARAAAKENLPFVASTVSSYSMEEVAAESSGDKWFQLYYPDDPDLLKSLVGRAERAGFSAIVVTVDTGMLGYRERDRSNGYSPFLLGKGGANYKGDSVFSERMNRSSSFLEEMKKVFYKPSLCWQDITYLRSITTLPIYLKGILSAEDARTAADSGIQGIVVSNHGGRQLDGCLASLDALSSIKKEVGDELTILFDSGIRRGSDIVKALALGADAVFVGRPYLYGLATDGESGVQSVLKQLKEDLFISLSLAGVASIKELDENWIQQA
ncbi:alpha-hydroxy-acid oxidizing protein [Guptibacillus hwajinpoensis]|uniref:alpha-hydroxy-acid oxidizing protein n=1 Tax=Guptibacillus hwajinpoensis TaxID=208199 RepID=UPI001CFDEEAE|nr:alpha-hydroxy-acid oxidizing protein [Pseudalkalibacillus hwajinpoensis]